MKHSSIPAVATLLSLLACYGTLLAIAALGAMGVAVSLNEGVWATAIFGFALLALLGLAFGLRRHGSFLPLILGAIGTGAIGYAMFVDYSRAVEIIGFLVLIGAVCLDWRRA